MRIKGSQPTCRDIDLNIGEGLVGAGPLRQQGRQSAEIGYRHSADIESVNDLLPPGQPARKIPRRQPPDRAAAKVRRHKNLPWPGGIDQTLAIGGDVRATRLVGRRVQVPWRDLTVSDVDLDRLPRIPPDEPDRLAVFGRVGATYGT